MQSTYAGRRACGCMSFVIRQKNKTFSIWFHMLKVFFCFVGKRLTGRKFPDMK